MLYSNFRSLNKKISKVGLGCVTFGREITEDESIKLLDIAVEKGINLFNTSYYYSDGISEKIIGKFFKIKKNRKDITIVSKIHGDLSKKTIEKCIHESLIRMNTDHIDYYGVTHDPKTNLDEILEVMDRFQKEGKILRVACNNYDISMLKSSNQIQEINNFSKFGLLETVYNVLYRGVEKELINYCDLENIDIISYSPLGAGFITGKYRNGRVSPKKTRFDIKPSHKDIYFKGVFFETMNKLEKLSNETNLSLIDLALSWVLSRDFLSSILIGVRDISHIKKPINILENPINRTILNEINEITKNNSDLIDP